jgi:hypothetical protein
MSCETYRVELIEFARWGGPPGPRGSSGARTGWPGGRPRTGRSAPLDLYRHLEGCPECAALLDSQVALNSAFEVLAAEPVSIPAGVEARLLAEFDRATRKNRFKWWLAAAATLTAGVFFIRHPAPRPAAEAFLEIPYVLPPAPYERTEVVRMEVPAAALVAAGFQVRVPDTGAAVKADVLVGQDGRPLAIRLISTSPIGD